MQNVRDLIRARAASSPDREYLIFQDRTFTFREVDRRSRQIAQGFHSLGLQKGDKVALILGNSPEFIFIWWALLRIGAVMVPINPKLGDKEITYIINHSEANTVVLEEASRPYFRTLQSECLQLKSYLWVGVKDSEFAVENFYTCSDDPPDQVVPISPHDNALIIYTSGTTGFPKGVIHTHANYLMTAESFARTIGLDQNDRLLTANPLFHVNAQFYSCMGTLFAGATLILAEKFSSSRMWDWTRRYRANKMVLLLALATMLYNRKAAPDDSDNPVEVIVAGGVPSGCYEEFQHRFGVKLQTLYSLSEAPLAIMSPPGTPCIDGAVGLPMIMKQNETNDIRIVDENLAEIPCGSAGEIMIRNNAIMKGYLKDPAATAQTLVNGWLRTGDRGSMDSNGWIRFLGRAKDVIRIKGENISTNQVEQVIAKHPSVTEVAVVGVRPPDASGEEEGMAFVVPAGDAKIDWEEIIAHCNSQLAKFKVPRFWKIVPQLPKNAMNRVVKARLTEGEPPERSPQTFDCKGNMRE
jgi:acyl-CoA synthetase (AMP-forming)/AMP-acid ligase II